MSNQIANYSRGDVMNGEIIYEKKYEHIPPMSEEEVMELTNGEEPLPGSFDEWYKKLMAETSYVPIKERITGSKEFVRTAIDVSQRHHIDTTIKRHAHHISAIYSFDCRAGMTHLQRVFGMADEFAFFKDVNDYDLTISMFYYTHAIIRKGHVVAPDIMNDEQ